MRDRLLIRHFLWRFLEHDLISADADRREVLSVAAGMLLALSLFVALLMGANYQLSNFMPPGIASIQAVDERFLYVSSSMLVMALLAVVQWDALVLDVRDTAVLGILPIRRSAIIRAKFLAVALLAVATAVAWNAFPTLLRFVSLPIALGVGVKGMLMLTVAHAVVTLAAGIVGFLAVLGLREGLSAILGQNGFRAISSALQAVLLVTVISALLLLPASSRDVARKWMAGDTIAAKALPPLWFVGLHETLAGSVIDSLPRTRPERYLIVQERNATALYRSLWPQYRRLGLRAIQAMALVTMLTFAVCALNSRRLPVAATGHRRRSLAARRVWRWIAGRVATSPVREAGFWFTLQTLPRRVSQRAAIASSLAIGLSLIVITVRGQVTVIQTDIRAVPVAVLASPLLLLASVLTGVRHATQVPAELRASSTFSLARTGAARAYVSGVKRAAWVALALPILVTLFLWHTAILGVRVATLHGLVGFAFSILLIEVLFCRYRRLPFVSAYVPSTTLKFQGIAYAIGMFALCFALAWLERASFVSMSGYSLLLATLFGFSAVVTMCDRMWRRSDVVIELDCADDVALPTQRLDLAG